MKHIKYLSCLFALLCVTACGPKDSKVQVRTGYPGIVEGKNTIALLVPLSGAQKGLGTHLKNAAQMALFDMRNPALELRFYDTKTQPQEAAHAAQQALKDGACLIIGPVFAEATTAAYQYVKGRVPLISLSNNDAIATDGLYAFGFHIEDQVARLFSFLSEKNKTHVALLAPKTPYGDKLIQYASTHAKKYGQVLVVIPYANPKEMQEAAVKIKKQPDINVLILPEGGEALKSMVSTLMYYDINLSQYKLAGTGLWDEPGIKPDAVTGGWYSTVDPRGRRRFEEEYQALYGQKPLRIATLAYDAVALAAALDQAGKLTDAGLKTPEGFNGLDGFFTFGNNGRVFRAFTVMEVHPDTPDIMIGQEKLIR